MGQQPSALNCKVNENKEKHEVTATKQFFARRNRPTEFKQQSSLVDNIFPSQNVISQKSPRTQMTRATSQKNLSSKSSRQLQRPKILIPEHEAITKVSETYFRGSVKEKKFYVEEKGKSLAEIVETRYNTPKHLPFSQILSLTQSLVYSLAYMTKKKCNHHDYYPTNIYYSEGRFKIINPLQLQSSGFYLTCQRQRFSFLSPQQIIAILEEASQADLGQNNMSKSDVFAVGMILLEVCSLEPSSECYDEESYNIVDSVIKQRLTKVVKVYTPLMAECINLMLQYEADQRIDPITLAQLLHCKIQNEKFIAVQMETPKQSPPNLAPQQGPPGPPDKRMMLPPQHMPPQQIRGPPPPYMHQPFKMQNLNQNSIAVSMPNQQFTRIGPNNQGFLSSSSLQQKLRVIQLIKQHPTEDDQEAENESKLQGNDQTEQNSQPNDPTPKRLMRNVFLERQEPKPQYPMVESILSQKPLIESNSQKQNTQRPQIVRQLIVPQNSQQVLSQPEFTETGRVGINRQINNINIIPNMNHNQMHGFSQNNIQTFVRQQTRGPLVQGYDERKVQIFKSEQKKPKSPVYFYNQQSKQQVFDSRPQTFHQSDYRLPSPSTQLKKSSQHENQFVTLNTYSTPTTSNYKNSPTINNIYTNQPVNSQTSFGQTQAKTDSYDSTKTFIHKYSTSFQTPSQNSAESIEERVQRVLNMSRNAK